MNNQETINSVNGNVMAWLASRQIDNENELAIRALRHQVGCVICGIPEIILWFPMYHSNLTDGFCDKCLAEYNYIAGEYHV